MSMPITIKEWLQTVQSVVFGFTRSEIYDFVRDHPEWESLFLRLRQGVIAGEDIKVTDEELRQIQAKGKLGWIETTVIFMKLSRPFREEGPASKPSRRTPSRTPSKPAPDNQPAARPPGRKPYGLTPGMSQKLLAIEPAVKKSRSLKVWLEAVPGLTALRDQTDGLLQADGLKRFSQPEFHSLQRFGLMKVNIFDWARYLTAPDED